MFKILVAVDENNAIGKDNALLCHLPDDLKHFKKLSSGHAVIMGRKTYDSIGKPLPNRKNIIISHQKNLVIPSAYVVHSLQEAIDLVKQESTFIIGGEALFKQALPLCDTIFLTKIHHQFEGADTYFPPIDLSQWQVKQQEYHPADANHLFSFSFMKFSRK